MNQEFADATNDVMRMRDRNHEMLLSREALMEMLAYGYTDNDLADVRNLYQRTLGFDPIWRYPFCDGAHLGAVIIPVTEGFLWLPYDEADREVGEIYLPDDATLLDAETCDYLIEEMERYVKPFTEVLRYIAGELRESGGEIQV